MNAADKATRTFLDRFSADNPHEPKFHQAVEEFIRSVMPTCLSRSEYREAAVLERLTEPDRIIQFRVPWKDDAGSLRINRGWRVQHSNCLGPYKGGLRLHKGVSLDALKFLAFEQTLKNSLTGLPMGGAKGGSNFDPKGRSDDEIMRFCESFMVELYRYIGDDVDVPAGDIGVGSREIGYLFGHYLRLRNSWTGILTGKGCSFGGSAGRPEATGYGCVRFCRAALHHAGEKFEGRRVAISGAGTVALYAAEKALNEGARVVTISDSRGFAHWRDGISSAQLDNLIHAKEQERCTLEQLAKKNAGFDYYEGAKPWSVECDVAMPCATENELVSEDAKSLIDNGVKAVCEGANMPCTTAAKRLLRDADIVFAPGKAANAGGVAVSGMEITQNAMRVSWSREKVDEELKDIMNTIHQLCVEHGTTDSGVDYVKGADVAGFTKVADALVAYGVT